MGTDKRRRPLRFGKGVPRENLAPLAPVKRLRRAIAATPDPLKPGRAIPDRRFAQDVLHVDERTLRRYLDRTRPIPGPVAAIVQRILDAIPAAAPVDAEGRSYAAPRAHHAGA